PGNLASRNSSPSRVITVRSRNSLILLRFGLPSWFDSASKEKFSQGAPVRRAFSQWSSAGLSHHQPVERHYLRLERIQFNLRQPILGNHAPTIHARLRFGLLSAMQPPQERPRGLTRSLLPQCRSGDCFDSVASQQLVPVACKQRIRREDVAPS